MAGSEKIVVVAADADRWNHNIHYHPVLLSAVPQGAADALDVGCGEGMLARRLAEQVPRVVGIDSDRASVETAKSISGPGLVEFVHGDFLTYPFQPRSFDFVVSVATLHHMDAAVALRRMAELLRPGGAWPCSAWLERRDWPMLVGRLAASLRIKSCGVAVPGGSIRPRMSGHRRLPTSRCED